MKNNRCLIVHDRYIIDIRYIYIRWTIDDGTYMIYYDIKKKHVIYI